TIRANSVQLENLATSLKTPMIG
ncbi:unnamed protein product, partial [Tuber melanosporum]